MDDDDEAAALHQLELEVQQWEEDYNAWLDSLGTWWVSMNNDPNWIKEYVCPKD